MKTVFIYLLTVFLLFGCTANTADMPDVIGGSVRENAFADSYGDHEIELVYVHAGKADCILLLADKRLYCIDTGLENAVETIVFCIGKLNASVDGGIHTIDSVFFTHGDRDHIGGYKMLASLYPITKTYAPWYSTEPTQFAELAPDVIFLEAGTSVPIGDEGMYLDVLGPLSRHADDNNNSLILRLIAGEQSFLFTGDMRSEEAAEVLTAYQDRLQADVWKVPYHGRAESVSETFLAAVHPKLSFVCADRETHPDSADSACLEMLSAVSEIYCTDDAILGWHLTIAPDGTYTVENLQPADHSPYLLQITEIDTKNQSLTIQNIGERADLSGCILQIEPSGSMYRIPEGTILDPDATITIGSRPDKTMLFWDTEEQLFRKKKSDTVTLYDPTGYILTTAESNA